MAGAVILIIGVPIVTVFTRIEAPIATAFLATLLIATVTGLPVAIVAGFNALVLNPVAAAGSLAAVGTRVAVDTIAVIAGFAFIDATVAAALHEALAGTAVTAF